MPDKRTADRDSNLPFHGWAPGPPVPWDVGIVVLGPEERVSLANGAARSLLAVTTDEELEDQWLHVKAQLSPVLQALGDGQETSSEFLVCTLGAVSPNLRLQVYPIHGRGGDGYVVLLQHAFRAAAVERSLRHAVCNRSLMSLSRDTSHDLKDVLNVISMNVELLSRVATLGGCGPTELKRADRSTDVVRRELKRLDRSLDALLDRDMIEHEAPQVFDVKAVCESILQVIAARAARQRVTVSTTMSEGAIEIRGFPDRIHAALLSLTVNALDAMPDGGMLHLSVTGTAGVRVCLCDSGPGISSDHVPDIWALHFTTKARGTGLGLYVTRSTVLAHGGTIRYLPHAGGGSCFVIDLPSTAH